jgi:hypothetical protein
MILKTLLALALCAVLGTAHAFNLVVKSDNPQLSQADVQSTTLQIAAQVGDRIPQDADIKVYVISHAQPSQNEPGRFIYLHRVELRKAFAGRAPYAFRGWLPIKGSDRYGIDEPAQMKAKLEDLLREFFTELKNVDPAQDFPG